MTPVLSRMAGKLQSVREKGLQCFGSKAHQFRLHPPAEIATLEAFEARHGISLPADYRAFLQHLGNGGAGPYYGLLPLDSWDTAHGGEQLPGFLAADCPFVPEMQRDTGWEARAFPHLSEDEREERRFQGTLSLVDQGCACYALLIVSGPARGRVLYVDNDGNPPYFVEHEDFINWYERWLDELLAGCESPWFGTGMPGFENELVGAIQHGHRREDAFAAMRRLPRLSPEGLRIIEPCLQDSNPKVRGQAYWAIGRFAPDQYASLYPGLRDEEPHIRVIALSGLKKASATNWQASARALLSDSDEGVARAAFDALAEHRTTDDLLRAAEHPQTSLANLALNQLAGRDGPRAAAAATRRLMDPLHEVRHAALKILETHQVSEAVPYLRQLTQSPDDALAHHACRVLYRHVPAEGLAATIARTRHPSALARQDAAQLLGELASQPSGIDAAAWTQAIAALEPLLLQKERPRDGNAPRTPMRVCDTAREALEQIRGCTQER